MIKMIHFVCKILALNQDFIIVPLCSLNEHLSSRLYFSVFFFKCGTTEYNGSYSEFNSGQLIYSTLVEGRIFRCLVQQT